MSTFSAMFNTNVTIITCVIYIYKYLHYNDIDLEQWFPTQLKAWITLVNFLPLRTIT